MAPGGICLLTQEHKDCLCMFTDSISALAVLKHVSDQSLYDLIPRPETNVTFLSLIYSQLGAIKPCCQVKPSLVMVKDTASKQLFNRLHLSLAPPVVSVSVSLHFGFQVQVHHIIIS